MPILQAESGFKHRGHVGLVVAVGVLEKIKVGCRADINAAVAERESGSQGETVGEYGHLVGLAVRIGVFKDLDAITAFGTFRRAFGIFVEFQHPQPASFVPGHGDGIDDLGFAGEEAHFEAGRHKDLLASFLGRESGRRRGQLVGSDLFPRRIVGVNREIDARAAWDVVGGGCAGGPGGNQACQDEARPADGDRIHRDWLA